jgi:hypothetical protein
MSEERSAKRGDWKTQAMSEQREQLPLRVSFTEAEFQRLKHGVIPQQMEDKWFIFYEDAWLYFHRSWTGRCAYQIRIEKSNGKHTVTEAWVSREGQDTATNLEIDLEVLGYLIYSVLLDKNWPWPRSFKDPTRVADPIVMWSLFGRHITRGKY